MHRYVLLLTALLVAFASIAEGRGLKCRHRVKHAQSLKDIAHHYHVKERELAHLNRHIHDLHWIHPGTVVNLPKHVCEKKEKKERPDRKHRPERKHRPDRKDRKDEDKHRPARHCTYTVQHGDYLYKIAQHYHTDVHALLALNPKIHNPNLIHTGDRINVPCRN